MPDSQAFDWLSRNMALAAISGELTREAISPAIAQRGQALVDAAFREDSVYASVCEIDGGDLSFYWVGGPRRISAILMSEGGSFFAVSSENGYHRTVTVDADTEVFEPLRVELESFSRFVAAANPNWRDLAQQEAMRKLEN